MVSKGKITFKNSFLILLGGIFLIIRARIGYCFDDEPFVVTLAQSLSLGNRLISQNWSGCQNTGVLLLPLYNLYHLLIGSNEGILLAFRYCYCFFWFLTCFFTYKILSGKHDSSIIVFLYLILFSPLDYMTLSYTSISLMACILQADSIYYNYNVKRLNPIVFGLLFSFSSCVFVLSYPFVAFFYVFFFLLFPLLFLFKKFTDEKTYHIKAYLTCIVSVLAIASVYCYHFVFKGSNLAAIWAGLQLILNGQNDYTGGPVNALADNLVILFSFNKLFLSCTLFNIFFSIVTSKKKNQPWPSIRFFLFAATSLLYLYCTYRVCTNFHPVLHNTLNMQMLSISLLGFSAYALLYEKPKKLFLSYVPLSIIYSVTVSISSNTYLLAVSMALSVSGISGIICIYLFLDEACKSFSRKSFQRLVSLLLSGIMLTQISSEIFVRFTRSYWEEYINPLRFKIESGAAKGIITSYANRESYSSLVNAINTLFDLAGISDGSLNFLSLTFSPIIYLEANLPIANSTTWTYEWDSDMIKKYYSANPEKKADVVFSSRADLSRFDDLFLQEDYSTYEYEDYFLFVKKS